MKTAHEIELIIKNWERHLQLDKDFVLEHNTENMDSMNDRIRDEELELIELREDLKHKLEEENQKHLTAAQSNVTFMLAKMQDLIERI
jgi:hypothetical protein